MAILHIECALRRPFILRDYVVEAFVRKRLCRKIQNDFLNSLIMR